MRRLDQGHEYAARLGAAARRDIIARYVPAAAAAHKAALLGAWREARSTGTAEG
jgi:hypothetical protein